MSRPFKMKGSPMKRNFGIGVSPFKKELTEEQKRNTEKIAPPVVEKKSGTKSGGTKSYSEAYSGLSTEKKAKQSEADFIKEAKAWNKKKYGSTEPTKEAKALKPVYSDVTDVKSGKKKLEKIQTYETNKAASDKESTEKFRAQQAKSTAEKLKQDAEGPKTKKRTWLGKIGAKLRNTVSKNKVNPHRKNKK